MTHRHKRKKMYRARDHESRQRKRRVWLLIAALFGVITLTIENAHSESIPHPKLPELFVVLEPLRAHVQQQIVQRIRLQSPDPFDALVIDIGEPADADIIGLQTPRIRHFEAWGNRGFVWETARAIIPTRSGTFDMPAIRISGHVSRADGSRSPFVRQWPARTVTIEPPAVDMQNDPWLVASEVTMTEDWSAQPPALRTGDIARRTIDVVVTGIDGSRLPDLVMPVSQGITVLPGAVERSTEVTDDGLIGRLRQQFDVRIETEGVTDISPVQLAWWHADENRLQRTAVRAWRIEPLASNALERAELRIREAASDRARAQRYLAMMLFVALVLSVAGLRFVLRRDRAQQRFGRLLRHAADALLGPRVHLPLLSAEVSAPDTDQRRSKFA